jgi:hypothetical protein
MVPIAGKHLEDIACYNKALHGKIKEATLSVSYFQFKDTMHSLIQKDVQSLLQVMENE